MNFSKLSSQQLEAFASCERFARYLDMEGGDREKAALRYYENLNECKRFYLLIHWLEVGLRNATNLVLIQKYGLQWYSTSVLNLHEKQSEQICEALERLAKQKKPDANPDLVATIGFGFWVNLYSSHYEELWRSSLRRVFQHKTEALKRCCVNDVLQKALTLRNRIAHYEPILHLPLIDLKQNIFEIIGWIDPVVKSTIETKK